MGREKLPKVQRQGALELATKAKKEGLDIKAPDIVAQKASTGEVLTAPEVFGAILKSKDLRLEREKLAVELEKFEEKGAVGEATEARTRLEAKIDEIDQFRRNVDLTTTESGRSLNALKFFKEAEGDAWTVRGLLQRAKASRQGKLTPEESGVFEKGGKKLGELQKERDRIQIEDNKIAEEAQKTLADRVAKELIRREKGFQKSQKAKEGILKEREKIKSDLKAIGFRVNDITGVTAEGSALIGKLAINYAKEGIETFPEIIKRVLEDVEGITEKDVIESIAQKSPKVVGRAKRQANKRVAQMRTQARLIQSIEKAEQGIFDKPQGKQPTAPEIQNLRGQLRTLRKDAFPTIVDGKKLESALKKIDLLQEQLDQQFRTIKEKKPIESASLKEAKDKIKALTKEIRLDDTIVDLKEQIRTGEFKEKKIETFKKISPKLERKEVEISRLKRDLRNDIENLAPITGKKVFRETVNTMRTLKATADVSYALRQGFVLSARRPDLAAKVFGKAFQTLFSENKAFEIDNAIRSAEHHHIREKAKLFLAELDGLSTLKEEAFMSNVAEKIPFWGQVVKASNRNMTTGLNLLRTSVFDAFLEKYPNATPKELAAYADYINVASGRGNLGKFEAAADVLGSVFFAPRFAISRIQTPMKISQLWKNPRVGKEIAKDFAAVGAVGATTLYLADMAGLDVGGDPRESDFGRITFGDTHVDIFAGFQQPMRLATRIWFKATDRAGLTGKDLTDIEKEFDAFDAVGNFVGYKVSPVFTVGTELLSGKSLFGEERTVPETVARAIAPIIIESTYDAFREQGAGAAGVTFGLESAGVGVNTFPRSERKARKDIREFREEGDFIAADQLQKEFNIKNPTNRIVNVNSREELLKNEAKNNIIKAVKKNNLAKANRIMREWNKKHLDNQFEAGFISKENIKATKKLKD